MENLAGADPRGIRLSHERNPHRKGIYGACFRAAGNEKGICKKTGKILVEVNPRYYRPTEVDFLLGDPSKAKRELGWEPKTTFKRLVEIMTDADFKLAEREAALK